MITVYEKPIEVKKGKTTVTFALAPGGFDPDEATAKGLFGIENSFHIWLKFDGTWYHCYNVYLYNSLKDFVSVFKRDIYTEEQFLEKIIKVTSP